MCWRLSLQPRAWLPEEGEALSRWPRTTAALSNASSTKRRDRKGAELRILATMPRHRRVDARARSCSERGCGADHGIPSRGARPNPAQVLGRTLESAGIACGGPLVSISGRGGAWLSIRASSARSSGVVSAGSSRSATSPPIARRADEVRLRLDRLHELRTPVTSISASPRPSSGRTSSSAGRARDVLRTSRRRPPADRHRRRALTSRGSTPATCT